MTNNTMVDQLEYKLLADPDDDEQWLIQIAATVIRINSVALEHSMHDNSIHYNYEHETISGEEVNREILDQVVAKVIVEQSEYHEGREEYLQER